MSYDYLAIHRLILTALNSDTLTRLCRYNDALAPITANFKPNMSLAEMADVAIAYCQREDRIRDLLRGIKEESPNRYRQFERDLFKNQITSSNLQSIIFRLNRLDHVYQINSKLRRIRNSAASFLIYGKPECGQDVLVEHLVHLATEARMTTEGRRRECRLIRIELGRRGVRSVQVSIDRLWREMNRTFTQTGNADASEAINNLLLALENMDVIIVLNEIDHLKPDSWDTLLTEFWHFIVKRTQSKLKEHRARLLLLLVDWQGVSAQWNSCQDASCEVIDPRYPIKLPESTFFSKDDLESWLAEIRTPITIEALLNLTDGGLPYLVYDWICNVYETSSEQILLQRVA